MRRPHPAFLLFVIFVTGMLLPAPAQAQGASDFGGQWTLNRELSQFPKEIGFTADWLTAATAGADGPAGGGRGGRQRGAVPNRPAPRVSQDDAERMQQLNA